MIPSDWNIRIAKRFYPEVFKALDYTRSLLEFEKTKNKKLSDESLKYAEEIDKLNLLAKDINKSESYINEYLLSRFAPVDNIRFIQKRKYAGSDIAIELNQFITPKQFEVQKIRKKLRIGDDCYDAVKRSADFVANLLTWTDDKNLDASGDYYLYAEETIVSRKGDCEDHSFVLASIIPEYCGVAYGFLTVGKTTFGHAFNVFVYNNKLYIAETTGNKGELLIYEGSKYKIHYIFTDVYTFAIDSSVKFGFIAGW